MIYDYSVLSSFFNFVMIPTVLYIIIFWELVWKGFGLWKAGRNNQIIWFIAILIFNTVGVLPIVYLLFFQKKKGKK